MKRFTQFIVICMVFAGILFLSGCKKSSETTQFQYGNLSISGFTAELETTIPKITYRFGLSVTETGGVGITITKVIFALYKDGYSQGSIEFTGAEIFGTANIAARGTLTATGIGITYSGGEIATSAEVQIVANDSEGHSIQKTATTDIGGTDILPKILQFSVGKTSVAVGEQTALHWKVSNANTVTISRNGQKIADVDLQGSMFITPSDSGDKTNRYKLTAKNSMGSIYDDSVVVTVRFPPVEYKVSGSARRAFLTYENQSGGTSQESQVLLPWSYKFTSANSGDWLYISAQNETSSGCVVVEIYKDGKLYKRSQSCGAYVIATASGFY